jgi:hypothetical protein
MSFDLTALGITEAIPTSNWDGFEGDAPVLPVESTRGPALLKGLYILKVPQFTVPTAPQSKDPFIPVPNKTTGRMQFKMTPEITRPEVYAGRKVYGFYIPLVKSDKQRFSRGQELIIATGSDARPNTDQEWLQAAFDLSGREFGAHLDLNVRDSQSQKEYFSKQDLFYKRADGSPKLSYVVDIASGEIIHKEGDDEATKMAEQQALDQQTGRRIYANPYIVRLVSVDEAIKALETSAASK